MTKEKWTKGPWRQGKSYNSIISDNNTGYDDDITLKAYGGHLVCESVINKHNANLISSAPDLYENLKECVLELEYLGKEGTAGLIKAKAALSKARGEQ